MSRAILLVVSAALWLGALALDRMGGRDASTVVAGAALTPEVALLGVSYVALHLAAALIAPVLTLAALLLSLPRLRGRGSLWRTRPTSKPSASPRKAV